MAWLLCNFLPFPSLEAPINSGVFSPILDALTGLVRPSAESWLMWPSQITEERYGILSWYVSLLIILCTHTRHTKMLYKIQHTYIIMCACVYYHDMDILVLVHNCALLVSPSCHTFIAIIAIIQCNMCTVLM